VLAAHYGGSDCRASALAAFNMAGSLGFATGPLLSGALLSLFGLLLATPHAAVFVVVGALEAGLAVAVYVLVRRGRLAAQGG
jgi:MFS family permease